jgi:hypothetical protein
VYEPTILLIDNFRGHNVKEIKDYNHIIPIFLPANTTSKTQPLDARIISNWKVKYRLKLMEYVLQQVDNNSFKMNEITLYRIVPLVLQAAREIKPCTIRKCFYNTLKLDIFNPVHAENLTDTAVGLQLLLHAMKKYLSNENELSIMHVLYFAIEDGEIVKKILVDVVVENPKEFTEGTFTMSQLRSYLVNTGCINEANAL